jgi:predicted house-cleaning noncanonical NTP pyrophosphatase (MazG superfamily)
VEKLVRDNMPGYCHKNAHRGFTPMKYRVASLEEMPFLLVDKLVEEAQEIKSAILNKEQLIEEIADLEEVLGALKRAVGIFNNEVEDVRFRKFLDRGGFDDGIVWDGNR